MRQRIPSAKVRELAERGLKWCPQCHAEKPFGEFFQQHGRPTAWCKVCKQAKRLERRQRVENAPDPTAHGRFFAKIEQVPNGCWNWMGARNSGGYGIFYYKGHDAQAHRVSLDLHGITPPEYDGGTGQGLVVDHACGNVGCVNPDHLRIVKQADNCTTLARSGPFKRNREATACPHGHPYVEGSYYSRNGCRTCKACTNFHAKAEQMARKFGLEPRPEWIAANRPKEAA